MDPHTREIVRGFIEDITPVIKCKLTGIIRNRLVKIEKLYDLYQELVDTEKFELAQQLGQLLFKKISCFMEIIEYGDLQENVE